MNWFDWLFVITFPIGTLIIGYRMWKASTGWWNRAALDKSDTASVIFLLCMLYINLLHSLVVK